VGVAAGSIPATAHTPARSTAIPAGVVALAQAPTRAAGAEDVGPRQPGATTRPSLRGTAMSADPQLVAALRASAPFEPLPEELLRRIAALGRRMSFRAGEPIYAVGSPADDVFVVLRGEVEHAFGPGRVSAADLVHTVGPGNVFGWASLLKDAPGHEHRTRLATTVNHTDSEVIAIDAEALIELLKECPANTLEDVRRRFATIVTQMYGLAGFVNVRGALVPAHIAGSSAASSPQFDTFPFWQSARRRRPRAAKEQRWHRCCLLSDAGTALQVACCLRTRLGDCDRQSVSFRNERGRTENVVRRSNFLLTHSAGCPVWRSGC